MGKRRFKLLSILLMIVGCVLGVISVIDHVAELSQFSIVFIILAIASVLIYGTLEIIEIVTE